jgi:hypothetical protein
MSPLFTYNGKLLVVDGKLATNENCCCGDCCIDEEFSISGISGNVGDCQATEYGLRTINRPNCAGTGPVTVTIYGEVDDELIVNGVITEPGLYPFVRCNGAHLVGGPAPPGSEYASGGYSFVLNDQTFTIAAGDNHGGNTGYSLKICFNSL